MKKRLFCLLLLPLTPVLAGIHSATMLTTPSSEGQKITQVVLEYDELLHEKYLPSVSAFQIKDRTIQAVSLGQCVGKTKICLSHQLTLHLADDGRHSLMTYQPAPLQPAVERKPQYAVKQLEPIKVFDGVQAAEFREMLPNTFITKKLRHQVIDAFVQREFKAENGVRIKYNLFVPENYDPQKHYPLVLFLHDEAAANPNVRHTLFQGNGATAWAISAFQAKHPAFVLAPQFDRPLNDNEDAPAMLEPTVSLIQSLMREFSIDETRLYATGQSSGAKMVMALNIKYPQFFAASYLVAGQSAEDNVAPMARAKQLVWVEEDNLNALLRQSAISEVLALNGAVVQRKRLYMGSDNVEQQVQSFLEKVGNAYYLIVNAQAREPNPVHTDLIPSKRKTAYDIEAVKTWLFNQRSENSKR